jgi:hypothetical protein
MFKTPLLMGKDYTNKRTIMITRTIGKHTFPSSSYSLRLFAPLEFLNVYLEKKSCFDASSVVSLDLLIVCDDKTDWTVVFKWNCNNRIDFEWR